MPSPSFVPRYFSPSHFLSIILTPSRSLSLSLSLSPALPPLLAPSLTLSRSLALFSCTLLPTTSVKTERERPLLRSRSTIAHLFSSWSRCSPLLSCPFLFPLVPRVSVQLSTFTGLSSSPSRNVVVSFLASLSLGLLALTILPPMVVQNRRSPPPLPLPYHRFRTTNSLGFHLLAPFSLPAGTLPRVLPASSDPHGHDREPRPNESRRLSASQPSDSSLRHATPRAACLFEIVLKSLWNRAPLPSPIRVAHSQSESLVRICRVFVHGFCIRRVSACCF